MQSLETSTAAAAPLAILLCFAAAGAVAILCRRARLLTASGAWAAFVMGGIIFACGGWRGATALLAFFVTSNALGLWRKRAKERLTFEKGGERDAWQVAANAGAAALAIGLAAILPESRTVLWTAFFAALAEANADTWATEIGAAAGARPRLITTMRPAAPGMSGAISLPGTLAALAGAAVIGAISIGVSLRETVALFGLITLSGFAGSLLDSLLGATVQAQYAVEKSDGEVCLTETGDPDSRLARGVRGFGNDAVNLLATAAAALLAFCIAKLMGL